jgi:hypothetical protein
MVRSSFKLTVPWVVALTGFLAGCQPGATPRMGPGWQIGPTLDAEQLANFMAAKPNTNRQDSMFDGYQPVRERRKQTSYKLQATAISAATWTRALGSVSSNFPAYAHTDLSYSFAGPLPQAGERVYAVTDAGMVYKVDATAGTVIAGWPKNALTALASPGTIHGSGLELSADNTRIYLLTTGGYFVCLNASTGAQIFTQQLTATSGFNNIAPFIDYSSGPDANAETLYAVANDGSIYRVAVNNGSSFVVTSWSPAAIGYPGAVTVTTYAPVWKKQAYVGDANGQVYRVDLSGGAPVIKTWYPSHLTSGNSKAIVAPVALDFDNSLNVSRIFVSCGDRVCWIDPTMAANDEALTVSPPLVVDATRPSYGVLSSYTYASTITKTYLPSDWISIAQTNANAPTRWGLAGSGSPNKNLIGSAGYTSAGDGDQCLGYVHFSIPVNDFSGFCPVGVSLSLSAATASASETVSVFPASNYQAGTSVSWNGYAGGAPDVDFSNRPNLLAGGAAVGSYTGAITASSGVTGNPRCTIPITGLMPTDGSDNTYALMSTGKARSTAIQWLIASSGATAPTLTVTLASAADTPAGNGIQCEPSVDGSTNKVWVVGSNALFELDTTSKATFQAAAKTRYDLTSAGLGASGAPGPTSGGSYVFPAGNALYDGTRMMVASYNPSSTRLMLDQFSVPLWTAFDSLTYYFDGGATSAQVGTAMLWDYPSGSLYATTSNNNLLRVAIKTAANGGAKSTVSAGSTFTDQPYGLALDPLGTVYVSSYNDNSISQITASGTTSTLAGGLNQQPAGLAIDSAGNTYVALWGAPNVSKITAAGVVSTFDGWGGYTTPCGVAISPAGDIYVSDNFNNAIYKITPAGVRSTFVAAINAPFLMCFDPSGNLYVANSGSKISMVTPAGVVSTYAAGLAKPMGVAYDPSTNTIIATENTSGQVDRFSPAKSVVATGLSGPRGVAVDLSGVIYVTQNAPGVGLLTVIK